MFVLNIFCQVDWVAVAGIITGAGTLYLAFVTKKMVAEIKRQRTTTYLPVLYVGNQPIYFIAHSVKGAAVVSDFSNISFEGTMGGYDLRRTYSASCLLYNGGFGIAKEVEYKWDFGMADFISKIAKLDSEGKYSFEGRTFIDFRCKGESVIGFGAQTERQPFGGGFVLPSGSQEIPLGNYLRFPTAYFILVAAFIDVSGQSIKIEDVPSLKLSLWYNDIERNSFYKEFTFSIELGIFQTRLPEIGFVGYAEVGRHQLMVAETRSSSRTR
jgi:hypothetical protein